MFRRYLACFDLKDIIEDSYDVIIVGSGIAGLYVALNINEKFRVLVLSKDEITENNSNLAQGGIAASLYSKDDIRLHIQDTLKAGSLYNNIKNVKTLVKESKNNIEKLIELGTNFDRDDEGKLSLTQEGSHSKKRVLHSKDETGKEIIRALKSKIISKKNIDILTNTFAIDVLDYKGICIGILTKNKDEMKAYLSKTTVLATGGIGQVYKNTTNSKVATGDGIAMAYRAGIDIIDMEFVQFHPTALHSISNNNSFLISEAVRGEGAILRNNSGEAFMEKYHYLKDLAPRDIVARSILNEMLNDNSDHVFLDITHRGKAFIKNRFPNIYRKCMEKGIDMSKDYIPVSPVQHYIMGGIKVDDNGRTNMSALYCCGETSCTGVHGANRLASNSLLEGIVFGRRLAEELNRIISQIKVPEDYEISTIKNYKKINEKQIEKVKEDTKEIMNKYALIVRSKEELKEGLRLIKELIIILDGHYSEKIEYFECVNITLTAYMILTSALLRDTSLGSHIMCDIDGRE